MTNSFLAEDYKAPVSNKWNYFKPSDQKTKIRIMSSAITGWIDWEDKTPRRTKQKPETSYDPTKPAKHFRACVIWNYTTKSLQIREITQWSIRDAITAYIKWDRGDPQEYDLVIYKEGKDLETKYFLTTTPDWKKPVDTEITDMWINTKIDLEELYHNWDPFDPESKF